jgi:translation initiation factor 2 alpha subunit (eIF-2alpha)
MTIMNASKTQTAKAVESGTDSKAIVRSQNTIVAPSALRVRRNTRHRSQTKPKERNTAMTEKIKYPASEMFDQAVKNHEQALRSGLKLQEDAGKYWMRLFNQAGSPQDLQKQVSAVANEVIPATQKAFQTCLDLMEQNSRAGVDLLKKGLEAAQTTSAADTQSKVVEFCEASLKSLKSNAQAAVDINAKALDSWIGLVKKTSAEISSPKAERA